MPVATFRCMYATMNAVDSGPMVKIIYAFITKSNHSMSTMDTSPVYKIPSMQLTRLE